MKKKISAKILITQLVILCMTLFIFPMKVKAENVSADLFLYNVHHTYEVDNDFVLPFRHKYEFYIHANHEVSGRFIISVTTPSGSSSHTWWCESGGEIYNNQIMDPSTGTTVYVTGQQDLKVTVMYLTDSAIDIMNVRSILFSQTDLDGNPITTDQSLWSYVQKIEDHEVQLLAQTGFINDQLTDTRQKLTAISTLLTTTNQTLSSLLTTATNILTKVTSIDTALQNIDNTIDTISWEYIYHGNGCTYSLSDQLVSPGELTYYEAGNSNLSGNSYYLYIKLPKINANYPQSLLKINLYGRSVAVTAYNTLSYHYFYGNTQMDNLIYYYKYVPDQSEVYVDGTLYLSQNNYIVVEQKSKTGWYIANSNIDIRSLNNNDIEYWELIGTFKQLNFYKQQLDDNKSIIDKLSELILGNNTTNQSVSNNDQSNQQFNQQQQQYDQIESTFQSSFTTDQQAVQQTFSNNSLTIFADTALWFTQQLNALYNASGQMKILFTMPLLLGLALFFIGRGAKTSAPNTIDSYYSSEMVDNTDGVRTYHVSRRSNAHKVYHGFNRGKK